MPAAQRSTAAEALAAAHALVIICVVYGCASLTKYLALAAAELTVDAIYLVASSPVEAAALALLAAWAVSWSVGGPSRAAQALSALQLSRLLGVALLQSALRQQLVPAPPAGKAASSQENSGKAGAATSPAQRRRLAPPSPGKDIASYRLPEHSLRGKKGGKRQLQEPAAQQGAAAQQPGTAAQQQGTAAQQSAAVQRPTAQQRWSMDAVPLAARQQVRALAKPRTSLDFDATPASPPPKGPRGSSAAAAQQLGHSRGSVADHRAAPQLAEGGGSSGGGGGGSAGGSPSRRREKSFRPRMQRIASGQELAELAAGLPSSDSTRFSIDSERGPGSADAQQAVVHPSLAAAVAASAAAAAGPAALSSWLPTRLLPAWSAAGSEDGSAAADSSAAAAELPTSPRQAAAAALDAVSRWAASTGTAAAAWTGSTLDAVLRPLIPGNGSAALAGATSLLWRSPSAPQSGASGSGEPCSLSTAPSAPLPGAGEAAAARRPSHGGAPAVSDRRRQSVDGVSPRHYTHGGVSADPNRLQALENLAAAARLQSCASRSRLGPPTPGHAAVAAGGAAAAGTPLGADAGASALASVGLDGDCPQDIREHVTDEHLLQFAASIGEEAAVAAAAQLALPTAWEHSGCLLGAADGGAAGCSEERWEQVVCQSEGGLTYEVWRQALRGGLYMYRSRAVFEGVSPRDLRPFHLDDHARHLWDSNVLDIRRLPPSGHPAGAHVHKHSEWCLHQYRSRFPRPLAAREYQYARRVWHRPSDGGAYVLCRGLPLPDAGDGGRAVKVTDIYSGAVIRATRGGGAELVTVYFEDSGVRPGLAKMAVKGMWAYMQAYDSALRVFADARRAAEAAHLSGGPARPPSRRSSLDAAAAGGGGGKKGRRRRRQGPLQRVAEQHRADGCESDGGSSSGDDALHSTYAAMARRLRGGAGAGAGGRAAKARWAGRLALLAGLRVAAVVLAARR